MAATETQPVPDPIPASEPAVPSLPWPDPGVFKHKPAAPAPPSKEPQ